MNARLKLSQHATLPWRINDIAPDFELIDAWALPTQGNLAEFSDLCEIFMTLDPNKGKGSALSRSVFRVRAELGKRLGWDDDMNTLPIPGCTEISLKQRLPQDLSAESHVEATSSTFQPVFRTSNEFALEISNSLLHAVMHLGWVQTADEQYCGQMGVYVKHRSRFGPAYMTAIAPFRHYLIYPALLKSVGQSWDRRETAPS